MLAPAATITAPTPTRPRHASTTTTRNAATSDATSTTESAISADRPARSRANQRASVRAHPGRILGNSPADGSILRWSLAWWPHAIAHGHVVAYTDALFAPRGTNLAWTTSIPAPTLLLAPVTTLAGPVAAFDVAAVLAPIVTAFAAYLLVHRLTGSRWPSLAAGLLFALSPLQTA